jgi:hypothetical protein
MVVKMEQIKHQTEKPEIGLSGEYLVYNGGRGNINTIEREIETTWVPINGKSPRLKCEYCGCIADKDYGTCDHCGAPLSESTHEKSYVYMENGKVLSHTPSIEELAERLCSVCYNFGI